MLKKTDKNQALHEQLQALSALFAARLPERLHELGVVLSQCLDQPHERDSFVTLHRLLHTLAGSAGTFGFAELGARARKLEEDLVALLADVTAIERRIAKVGEDLRAFLLWAASDLKGDDAAPPLPAPSQPQDPSGSAEPAAAMPVYLVSNDTASAQDMAVQLEYFGYDIVTIDERDRLASAVFARPPAAIVMDFGAESCVLNGGIDIARLRETSGRRIPAIILSTQGNFDARLAAVRAGADGYFTKPVDVVALSDRLDVVTARGEVLPYRILIVDDDVVTAQYYSTVLSGIGMDVKVLHQPVDILRVLGEYRPELILMDVYMPECNGIELAKLVRQDNTYLDVPIVFLSSESNLSRQLDAIESGADDFITKPVQAEHLISSISNRAKRYRALRGLIMRDGLTGLYNHSAIKEHLMREIARANRGATPLALAMIDLDFFKRVNDTYGHPIGDQVIRALSRMLQQRLRRGDIVGRYGGEEFAVILPGTTSALAISVLDQIRIAFAKIRHHADDVEFAVTFSAGVADINGHSDGEALFRAADAALYCAKQQGRNRIENG